MTDRYRVVGLVAPLLLAAGVVVGLVGISIEESKVDALKAQLERAKSAADAELLNDRQKDGYRIELLTSQVVSLRETQFEDRYELDTNLGRSCNRNQDGSQVCSAVQRGETRTVRFHCDVDGCEFDECGAVK